MNDAEQAGPIELDRRIRWLAVRVQLDIAASMLRDSLLEHRDEEDPPDVRTYGGALRAEAERRLQNGAGRRGGHLEASWRFEIHRPYPDRFSRRASRPVCGTLRLWQAPGRFRVEEHVEGRPGAEVHLVDAERAVFLGSRGRYYGSVAHVWQDLDFDVTSAVAAPSALLERWMITAVRRVRHGARPALGVNFRSRSRLRRWRLQATLDGSVGIPLALEVTSAFGRVLARVRLLELAPGRVAPAGLLRLPPPDQVSPWLDDQGYSGDELARYGYPGLVVAPRWMPEGAVATWSLRAEGTLGGGYRTTGRISAPGLRRPVAVTERHFTWRGDLPAEGLETREEGLLVLRRILARTYVRLDGDPADAPALRRMMATLTPTPPRAGDDR